MDKTEDLLNSFLKESNVRGYNPINRLTGAFEHAKKEDVDTLRKALETTALDATSIARHMYGEFEPKASSIMPPDMLVELNGVQRCLQTEVTRLKLIMAHIDKLQTSKAEKTRYSVRTNFEALALASVDTFVDIIFNKIRTECAGEADPRAVFKEFLEAPYDKNLFE